MILHVHSIYSDGTLKPKELIAKAITKELQGIALTDHDSIAGIAEAREEVEQNNFLLVPGIEMTTDYGQIEAHILGYNFDLTNVRLHQKLQAVQTSRSERARKILKKLNTNRIPLSWEQVKSKTTSSFIGRTHIFKALEASGQVAGLQRREAFEYYLGKNGIAFVPHEELSTLEAIDLIRSAGGVAVLAHPGRMGANPLIAKLIKAGLNGIEVHYPSHTPEMVAIYLKLAAKYQLVVTGGSDYHGAFGRTKLGEAQVESIAEWYREKRACSVSII